MGTEDLAMCLELSQEQTVPKKGLFETLQALAPPLIDIDAQGGLGGVLRQVLQLKVAGRLLFEPVIKRVRAQMSRSPGEWTAGERLLEEGIERWEPGDCREMQLERRFVLKELRFGRRFDVLPVWAGRVSEKSEVMSEDALQSVCEDSGGGRGTLRSSAGGGSLGLPPAGCFRQAFPFDVYISHAWGPAPAHATHQRAKLLSAGLERRGLKPWLDHDQMQGNTLERMAEGIEGSAVVLICVTREYMDKVAQEGNDNCKLEFEYAYRKRTRFNKLPAVAMVMEESLANPAEWRGSLGLALGSHLY